MKWCYYKIVCTFYFVDIQCIIQPDGEYSTDNNRSITKPQTRQRLKTDLTVTGKYIGTHWIRSPQLAQLLV